MKFFWKIFFAVMFVSVGSFSFGGYMIINSDFNALLDNEIKLTNDFGDVLYKALLTELEGIDGWEDFGYEREIGALQVIASLVSINDVNGRVRFVLRNSRGEVIFRSFDQGCEFGMIGSLNKGQRFYCIREDNGFYYVQGVRPARILGSDYQIEIIRDVSFVFEGKDSQLRMMLSIMGFMVFVVGIITFVISKLLMRQVVSLCDATRLMASGDLRCRVCVRGSDEFSVLSESFNKMADELEDKINYLLEESVRKDMFVAAFSHEIKTPLTSIIGYADTLRRKGVDYEKASVCADYIFSQGKSLEALSMRLLDLMVLKNTEIFRSDVDISDFFCEIKTNVGDRLRDNDVWLGMEFEPAKLNFEPELMKTVFVNLIDNGIKACEEMDKKRVVVKGHWEEEVYVVSVFDNGKGMKEHEILRIRDAFYMADKSRSKRQGGYGLGLSICDAIVKLHNFDMVFESRLGEGTKVMVLIK